VSMREQIVTVAEKIIRTDGLAHATTRSIAMHAGCSEGTIYRHFRSKEDVFIAVLTERLPKFATVMKSIASEPGQGDARGNLSAVMRSALEFYQVTIPVNVAIFAEPQMLSQHRNWMQEHNVGPHRGVELLAEYIAKEQASGRLSAAASPIAAASMMLGSCYLRAYSKQFADVTPRSDNKFISDTIALIFGGMNVSG
jgi:AcrR family transcriptional regulator